MGKLSEAYVEITGRRDKLDRTLGRVRSDLGSFATGATRALAIPVSLATAGATAALAGFLIDATKKGMDLGETLNKIGVTFGESSDVVLRQADMMAEKFGVVKNVALEAASNLGLIAQGAGLTQAASAELSNRMVQLAADASSFFNVPVDVALDKIRAGLVGEAEPLRTFGVNLSEGAVKTEALRMKLVTNANALTDSQKVMARASLIMRSMSKASGDLGRTLEGNTNQIRKFQGDIENLQTELGRKLQPALADGIRGLNNFKDAIESTFDVNLLDQFVGKLGDVAGGFQAMTQTNEGESMLRRMVHTSIKKAIFGTSPDIQGQEAGMALQGLGIGKAITGFFQKGVAKATIKPEGVGLSGLGQIGGSVLMAMMNRVQGQVQGKLDMAGMLANAGVNRAKDLSLGRESFQAQSFSSIAESSRSMQLEYLSGAANLQKQQLDKIERTNQILGEVKQSIAEALMRPVQAAGAILRGE
jgi:hypothetical protein